MKEGDTVNEEIKQEEGNSSDKKGKNAAAAVEGPKIPVNAGKKLMQYAKREWRMFTWGIIALIGGNFGQLVIPYYVGLFTDKISSKKYDEVYSLCWELVVINLVRTPIEYS